MDFAEVAVVAQEGRQEGRAEQESVWERLEVVLAGGRRISVPARFDEREMLRLVAVLEATSC